MRMLLLVLLVGCSKAPPAPPDPKAFAAMTADQKCAATAPRGTQCIEEIMSMQVRQLTKNDELGAEVDKELDRGPRASGDEAATIHETSCAGDPKFADAVFACWAEPGCTALAACIDKRTRPVDPVRPAEPAPEPRLNESR